MVKMTSKLGVLIVASLTLLSACLADSTKEKDLLVFNGFVLGDKTAVAKPLIVGVGDSVERLAERNPFLGKLKFNSDVPLQLPLMTKVDVTYDDGSMRFDVGCATIANLDGNDRFGGVAFAGFSLCDPSINDWAAATRRASQIIEQFKQSNPEARNLKAWLQKAGDSELRKLGGKSDWAISKRFRDPVSEGDANARFARLAAEGHEDQLRFNSGTELDMAFYAGEKAIFIVSISKYRPYGGDNLTDEQRLTMAYRVGVLFQLREDVTP